MRVSVNDKWDKEVSDYVIEGFDITNIPVGTMLILIKALKTFSEDFDNAEVDRLDAINFCETVNNEIKNGETAPTVNEDCTEFLAWLLDEVMDEDNWELNAVANGEIICRKLKKLGLLEVKDGYYVRANVTPIEKTGEWIEHKYAEEYDGFMQSNFECSKCHDWLREQTNYCPNCGAKMKGDK